MNTTLKFHWALPIDAKKINEAQKDSSGLVDINRLLAFVTQADDSPIDSLLTPFGFHMPDPFPLVGMLSSHVERIKFMVAYRPGLMSPTLFAQQMSTLSQLLPGRLSLNVVAGFSPEEQAYYGDHLSHDERFERSMEYIEVLQKLWKQKSPLNHLGKYYDLRDARINTSFIGGSPRIYLSGNSKIAQTQAGKESDCWLRYGDTPQNLDQAISALPQNRKCKVGIRMSIVSGSTRKESLERAAEVVANPNQEWKLFLKQFIERCDSNAIKTTYELAQKDEWLSDVLWTGAVPFRGGPALALVGSYDRIAQEIINYKKVGVTEFIFSGWLIEEELYRFSNEIFPRVLRLERSIRVVQPIPTFVNEPASKMTSGARS